MATNTDGNFKSWPDKLDGVMWRWWNARMLITDLYNGGLITTLDAERLRAGWDKTKNKAVNEFYGTKK